MTWSRLSDDFWRHPKTLRLLERPGGLEACGLFALMLSWVAENLTDGHVPAKAPLRLVGDDPSGPLAALEAAGYLERTAGGWLIRNYLTYNASREDRDKITAERRLAGLAGAEARWGRNGNSHGNGYGSGHSNGCGSGNGKPDAPVPGSRLYVSSPDLNTQEDPTAPPLTRDELGSWADFTAECWGPFRKAWHGRGFRKPPTTRQREVLYEMADARPNDLARWISDAPGRSGRDVVGYALQKWDETKAAIR